MNSNAITKESVSRAVEGMPRDLEFTAADVSRAIVIPVYSGAGARTASAYLRGMVNRGEVEVVEIPGLPYPANFPLKVYKRTA